MRDVSALLKKLLEEAKEAENYPRGEAPVDRSMLNQYSPGIQIAELTETMERVNTFLNSPRPK